MSSQRFPAGDGGASRRDLGCCQGGGEEDAKGGLHKASPASPVCGWCRPASIAPWLALLSCVLYCVNGELLQALQVHTPQGERHASVGINLVLCHLGGLAFAPHFLLAGGFSGPSASTGLLGGAAAGLGAAMAKRPRLAALLLAWVLMGYNYAWLSSTRFVAASTTNAVFQSSAAMVYAASVPLFGEPVTPLRLVGIAFMMLGSMLASHSDADGGTPSRTMSKASIGVCLALIAAVGVSVYQVAFRYMFGHLKNDVRFLAFFSAWVSVWHVLTVLPALYLASAVNFEALVWPQGRYVVAGTLASAVLASTVNALYLCIALWGSVMLLPCASALSVPLTVALDAVIHGVHPSGKEVAGHMLVVMAVVLIMNVWQYALPSFRSGRFDAGRGRSEAVPL